MILHCTNSTKKMSSKSAPLEKEIKWREHPHPLLLVAKTPYDKKGTFRCDAWCQETHTGEAYRCAACKYDVCVKCAVELAYKTKQNNTRPSLKEGTAKMLFPSSGRCGFELHTYPLHEQQLPLPTFELLKAILQRENAVRLAESTQEELDATDNAEETYTALQKQIVREFGFQTHEEQLHVLKCMRSAVSLFPDKQQELGSLSLYVKYNLAQQGTLTVGDALPQDECLLLTNLQGTSAKKLADWCCLEEKDGAGALVLVAGSGT